MLTPLLTVLLTIVVAGLAAAAMTRLAGARTEEERERRDAALRHELELPG